MVLPWLAPVLLPIAQRYPSTRPAIATAGLLGFIGTWLAGVLSPVLVGMLLWKGKYAVAAGAVTFIVSPYILKPRVCDSVIS